MPIAILVILNIQCFFFVILVCEIGVHRQRFFDCSLFKSTHCHICSRIPLASYFLRTQQLSEHSCLTAGRSRVRFLNPVARGLVCGVCMFSSGLSWLQKRAQELEHEPCFSSGVGSSILLTVCPSGIKGWDYCRGQISLWEQIHLLIFVCSFAAALQAFHRFCPKSHAVT